MPVTCDEFGCPNEATVEITGVSMLPAVDPPEVILGYLCLPCASRQGGRYTINRRARAAQMSGVKGFSAVGEALS